MRGLHKEGDKAYTKKMTRLLIHLSCFCRKNIEDPVSSLLTECISAKVLSAEMFSAEMLSEEGKD